MNDDLQELKAVLQLLALPVIGQVHLLDDDCARVEFLAAAFSATYRTVCANGSRELVPEQAAVLLHLDDRLNRLRRQCSPPLCSELALRNSSDWRQIRVIAREALVRFRWTLGLPPQEVISKNVCLN